VEATTHLLAREYQKAFFWIRSMAQSGRGRKTERKPGKKTGKGR